MPNSTFETALGLRYDVVSMGNSQSVRAHTEDGFGKKEEKANSCNLLGYGDNTLNMYKKCRTYQRCIEEYNSLAFRMDLASPGALRIYTFDAYALAQLSSSCRSLSYCIIRQHLVSLGTKNIK